LRAGFDNAIAIEGAKIDETVIKLTEGKKVIAFLDGDRAGDLILKELHGVVNIDKVLRAPSGREVEECTPLEIAEILREGMQLAGTNMQEVHATARQLQYPERRHNNKKDRQEHTIEEEGETQGSSSEPGTTLLEENAEILSAVKAVYPQINETLEAIVLDGSMKILLKVPVSDVVKKLDRTEGAKMLVLDGIVTQRLVDAADRVGIEYIVGHRTGELKKSTEVRIRTFVDMGINN
jgi:DNA primase